MSTLCIIMIRFEHQYIYISACKLPINANLFKHVTTPRPPAVSNPIKRIYLRATDFPIKLNQLCAHKMAQYVVHLIR